MKKLLSIITCIAVILAMMPSMAFADGTSDEVLNIVITDADAATIDETLTSATAVAISKLTEEQRTNATKLVISTTGEVRLGQADWTQIFLTDNFPNVTKIDASECRCEKTVIPDNVAGRIKQYQGIDLTGASLESITWTDDPSIHHSRITEFELPNTLQMVNSYALCNFAFDSIEFPESLIVLCNGSFSACNNLKNITIPDTLLYIGNNAFGLDSLTQCDYLIVGQHVSYIDTNAFKLRQFNDYVVIQSSSLYWSTQWNSNDWSKDNTAGTIRIWNGSDTEKIQISGDHENGFDFSVPAGSTIQPEYNKTTYYALDHSATVEGSKQIQSDLSVINHYDLSCEGTLAINHYDNTKGKYLSAELVTDGQQVYSIQSPATSISSTKDTFSIPAGSTVTKSGEEPIVFPADGTYKSITIGNRDIEDLMIDSEGKLTANNIFNLTLKDGTIVTANTDKGTISIVDDQASIPAGSTSSSGTGTAKTTIQFVDEASMNMGEQAKSDKSYSDSLTTTGKVVVQIGQDADMVTRVKAHFGDDDSDAIVSVTGGKTSVSKTGSVSAPAGSTITLKDGTSITATGTISIGADNSTISGAKNSEITITKPVSDSVLYKPTTNGSVIISADETVTLITENGTKYSGMGETVPTVNEDGTITIPAGAKITSSNGVTNTVETTISNLDLTTHTHIWNEGEVTVQPTVSSEGERKYICTGCSEAKIESIPKVYYNSKVSSGTVKTDSTGTVIADIEKSTETSDGNTVVTVTEAVSQKLNESISEGKDVIINATSKNNTESKPIIVEEGASVEVGVPETTVKALAEKNVSNLVIKSDNAAVVLDKTSIDAVADKAGDDGTVKLVVEVVKADVKETVVDVKIVTSKGTVSDFKGGNVSVTIALDKQLQNDNLVCVYIDSEGIYHKVDGTLNDDGTYTFVTGHFSTYAVMAEADADKAIADQLAEIKATTIKLKSVKGKGYIKLTWSKKSKYSLDGYEVYRGKSKASLKKWGTARKTSYRNAKYLKKGNKYYYKVRGYKVVDGKKIYTRWSNINYRKAI